MGSVQGDLTLLECSGWRGRKSLLVMLPDFFIEDTNLVNESLPRLRLDIKGFMDEILPWLYFRGFFPGLFFLGLFFLELKDFFETLCFLIPGLRPQVTWDSDLLHICIELLFLLDNPCYVGPAPLELGNTRSFHLSEIFRRVIRDFFFLRIGADPPVFKLRIVPATLIAYEKELKETLSRRHIPLFVSDRTFGKVRQHDQMAFSEVARNALRINSKTTEHADEPHRSPRKIMPLEFMSDSPVVTQLSIARERLSASWNATGDHNRFDFR